MDLPLLEKGLIQTVFPNTFLIYTMGTSSPPMARGGFDWAGPAQLAAPLVLTDQVAFAICRSQCLKVPSPIAFSVVFNSPLYCSVFPEAGA